MKMDRFKYVCIGFNYLGRNNTSNAKGLGVITWRGTWRQTHEE